MNIMLVYGGRSSEHDISIITACLARGHFDGKLFGVYFDKNNRPYLVGNNVTPKQHLNKFHKKVIFCCGEGAIKVKTGPYVSEKIHIDVVVNCCHGLCGEDGTVAALCGLLGVPVVGSDIVSSGVAMDKVMTKIALRGIRVPVLNAVVLRRGKKQNLSSIKLPVVVKPSRLGSSIGVAVCHNMDQLVDAVKTAFTYDDTVLCERALVDFTEVNCSALTVDGVVNVSNVDTPVTVNEMLTFEDKYVDGGKYLGKKAVCNLAPDIVCQVQKLTKKIYQRLGFSGVVRVDFLLDNTCDRLYVNEINSVPGSLAYGLWQDKFGMLQFGNVLLQQAQRQFEQRSALVADFSSSVLSGGHGKK